MVDWLRQLKRLNILFRSLLRNDIILDAMMGSGTTGIAALRQNRKFIGIDSDEKQYNLAKNDLSKITTPRLTPL